MPGKFDYKPLLSKVAPEPRTAGTRAKYDFAVAYPDPSTIPVEGLWKGLRDAIRKESASLALYPPAQGHEGLRELVARKLARDRDIRADKSDIVLGHGSGQLIRDVFALLLDPGDTVLTEQFFYSGTLRVLRHFKADLVGVPMDEEGMRADELERILGELKARKIRPKLIYTIPGFHNPSGSVMSRERRLAILDAAHKYGVPILEDDCYVDLRYEGDMPPSIYSLDGDGQTMYVSSFSKIVGPGVRMGWLVAPKDIASRVNSIRMDGGANHLTAMALALYLEKEMYEHIDEINAVVRAKRDAMLSALGEYFPPSCKWTKPKGGLFIWLELPRGVDSEKLRDRAFEAGVGYVPGVMFSPSGQERNCLRLCFGWNTPDEIKEGIRILSEVFEREGVFTGK